MTAQEKTQEFLPKEPLDLPREPKELPEHASAGYENETESAEVKTLLSWHAPGRPFRERGKDFFISSSLIALLILVILFLFKEWILMLVVLSFLFVVFALKTVPPHNFHYRVSSEGITIEDHFFLWQELYDFYFKHRDNHDVLHIRTKAFFPGELTLTLGDMDKNHLKSVLLPYLPYREVVKPTFTEKAGDWLAKTFPLERPRTP